MRYIQIYCPRCGWPYDLENGIYDPPWNEITQCKNCGSWADVSYNSNDYSGDIEIQVDPVSCK